MADQLTFFTTRGGETVAVKPRGVHYIEPRGYAAPPGTGPAGETCKTCTHLTYKALGKNYPKCLLREATWTGGRATDILVNAPACQKWEAPPPPESA